MYMRLGFAVAIHVDPDVLLVDEVLAVGDEGFTHKCLDKFGEFRRRGKTILLVTHSLGLVERFCDEALWIDGGVGRAHGDPRRVVGAYVTDVEKAEEDALASGDQRAMKQADTAPAPDLAVADPVAASETPDDMFRATEGRWGSREIDIAGVTLFGTDGQPSHVFHTGDAMTIQLAVSAAKPMTDFAFGVAIFNADGICCYGTNTWVEELAARSFEGQGEVRFVIENLDLIEGTYKIDVAAHSRDGYPYDYHRLLYTFRVKSRTKDVGIFRPRHRWEFSPSVQLARR